jgi:hypothetical protein
MNLFEVMGRIQASVLTSQHFKNKFVETYVYFTMKCCSQEFVINFESVVYAVCELSGSHGGEYEV